MSTRAGSLAVRFLHIRVITREHGTQVEAGDESLVLRCATLDEREAWVGAIQMDPNSLTLSLPTNPLPDHSPSL